MEPLPSFEHIQGEVDLWTVPLALDTVESILQVQPKADLLKGSTTRGISFKTSHLQMFVCVCVCVCVYEHVNVNE